MASSSRPPVPLMNVLHLEDSVQDAELIRGMLEEKWPGCQITRVYARDTFIAALHRGKYDIILSDFSMPNFDGLTALDLAMKHDSDTPFIFLSGTIGEENAVEALRRGATDYVIKDRPGRLVPAISRALAEVREHRMRRSAEIRVVEQAELLEKAHDAIVVSDLQRRIIYWNRGATRVFGWTAEEAVGRISSELFGPSALAEIESARSKLTGDEWRGEVKLHDKSGKILVLDSRVTIIRDDAGQPKSNLIISTDISEQKQLEVQFLRAQRLDSIGTLAGGIAHDLNNVLSPVLMSVNLVQQKTQDPDILRLMSIVESSAKHGGSLVQQILAFARGAEGARANLRLKMIVRELVSLLGETLPRAITVDSDIAPDLAMIFADGTQVSQVLMNLCVNARDAMPKGGRLLIRALNVTVSENQARANPGAKAGPHVLIAVEDTGTGIPPEIIDRIFDPFFTTKAPGKGTGLGLATSLGIVKDHGGFMQVQSEPGNGTIFSLYFPAVESGERPGSAHPIAELPMGNGETILVIDDEASIREMTRSILETFGYVALTSDNGLDGIALYMQHRHAIGAVLVDMNMPTMQGGEVIRHLRTMNPDVSVVIMSGMPDDRTQSSAESPHLTFLHKPMTAAALVQAIRRVLN